MNARRWLLTLTIVIGGCGGDMMSGPDTMRDHVRQARAENDAHVAAVDAAPSLEAARAEAARHEVAMTRLMGDMDMTMDGMMSHCSGDGMSAMHELGTDMMGEMDAHRAIMDACADLPAAHAEATRHHGVMAGMMDGMNGAMEHMGCGL